MGVKHVCRSWASKSSLRQPSIHSQCCKKKRRRKGKPCSYVVLSLAKLKVPINSSPRSFFTLSLVMERGRKNTLKRTLQKLLISRYPFIHPASPLVFRNPPPLVSVPFFAFRKNKEPETITRACTHTWKTLFNNTHPSFAYSETMPSSLARAVFREMRQ